MDSMSEVRKIPKCPHLVRGLAEAVMTALLGSFFLVCALLFSSKETGAEEGTGAASPRDHHLRYRLGDLNPGSNWKAAVVLFGMAVLLCIGISYLCEISVLCAEDQSQSEQVSGSGVWAD